MYLCLNMTPSEHRKNRVSKLKNGPTMIRSSGLYQNRMTRPRDYNRQRFLSVVSLVDCALMMSHFDQLLTLVGEVGKYNFFLFTILGLTGLPTGWQNLLMIFIGGQQEHWCSGGNWMTTVNSEDAFERQCMHYNVNYTEVAFVVEGSQLTEAAYPALMNETSLLTKCDHWEYNVSGFATTIISKWDLVCDNEYLVTLASSIYMTGFLTGAVTFGTISDIIGRKKTILAAVVLEILASLSAAVTSQYGHYIPFVVLRFLVGNAAAGKWTVAFVIVMEIVGVKYRMYLGILFQCWFASGFMSLCGIAYFIRDHFLLQLSVSVPVVLLLSYIWLLPESPRWLYAENRAAEAEVIMRKIAKCNKKSFPTEEKQFQTKGNLGDEHQERATLMDVLRRPRMRIRLLVISFCWFVTSFVYYGLSYNTGSLSGNIYVNTLINASMEIPACIAMCFVLNRFGRRWILLLMSLLAGISLLGSIPGLKNPGLQGLVITLSNIGKFGSSASFAIVYVFTAELFPTVVRNVAVGSGSTCARVGSLLAPQLIHLDKYVWFGLSSLLMGSLSVVAGGLALILPETNRARLPETLSDGENFGTVEYKRVFYEEHVGLQEKPSKTEAPLMKQDTEDEAI